MTHDPMPVPSESVEQQRFFQWAALMRGRWPELAMLYHVPNEGRRTRATGARLRAEGLRAGVPDVNLDAARGGYHGLRIEFKRRRGGRVSPEQREWLDALRAQGYAAVVAHGWEEAAEVTERYLRGEVVE